MIGTSKPTTLAAAFIKAQSEFPQLKKTATNPHFKSKFCPLEDMIAQIFPVLQRNGLAYIQRVDGNYIKTLLLHDSGESLNLGQYYISDGIKRSEVQSKAGDCSLREEKVYDPQFLGSCVTYGRRYAMATDLGLAADDDDDGNSASGNASSDSKPKADSGTKKSMF